MVRPLSFNEQFKLSKELMFAAIEDALAWLEHL